MSGQKFALNVRSGAKSQHVDRQSALKPVSSVTRAAREHY